MSLPKFKPGQAFAWKAFQFGGVKLVFFTRTLVLAIILVPDDFGLFAIALASMELLQNLSNPGLYPALIQKSETDWSEFHAAWTVEVLRSLLITLVLIVFAPQIAMLFDEPRAAGLIRLIALRPLLLGLSSPKLIEQQRNLNFKPAVLAVVSDSIVHTLIAILLAAKLGVVAMISGILGGAAAYLLASYMFAPVMPKFKWQPGALLQLFRFGKWLMLTGLIVVLTNFSIRVLITRMVGTAALGLYYMAIKLAFLPVEVVDEIINSVSFSMFARLQSSLQSIRDLFRSLWDSTAVVVLPILTLLIVLAPDLINSVLGTKWNGTAELIRLLAVAGLAGMAGEVIIPVLKGLGDSDKTFKAELWQSLFLVLFTVVFTSRSGIYGAALAWIPAVIIAQIFSIFWINRKLVKPLAGKTGKTLFVLFLSVLCAVTAGIISGIWPHTFGLLFSILAALSLYFILLYFSSRRFEWDPLPIRNHLKQFQDPE